MASAFMLSGPVSSRSLDGATEYIVRLISELIDQRGQWPDALLTAAVHSLFDLSVVEFTRCLRPSCTALHARDNREYVLNVPILSSEGAPLTTLDAAVYAFARDHSIADRKCSECAAADAAARAISRLRPRAAAAAFSCPATISSRVRTSSKIIIVALSRHRNLLGAEKLMHDVDMPAVDGSVCFDRIECSSPVLAASTSSYVIPPRQMDAQRHVGNIISSIVHTVRPLLTATGPIARMMSVSL